MLHINRVEDFEKNLIEKAQKTLKCLDSFYEDEFYVFLLLFRKKWLLRQYERVDQKLLDHLSSKQVCLFRTAVRADTKRAEILEILKRDFESSVSRKVRLKKGFQVEARYLIENCPRALSLVFTFEPRSLKKAIFSFYQEVSSLIARSSLFETSKSEVFDYFSNLDSNFKTLIQKSDRERGRKKFVLVDVDTNENSDFSRLREFEEALLSFFEEKNFRDFLRYRIETPCRGLHFVFEISKPVQREIFEKKSQFRQEIKEISKKFLISLDDVEIKTGPILTHAGSDFSLSS